MRPEQVLVRAGELADAGKSFALATVVSVVPPASTRRGDRALITRAGDVVGWVGGACSEPIVVRESLRALADGEPRLVRIGPRAGGQEAPEGVVVAVSHCASEGTVEVLIEPQRPAPLLAVFGDGPAASTLAELARTIGWRVADDLPGADAVVIATMGRGDEDLLEAALAHATGYVGLVASARRAEAVLGDLRGRGVPEDALARVRSPAGLDLGPVPQEEIAVAVLAELVAWRQTAGDVHELTREVVDPVCGMTVAGAGAEKTEHQGTTYVFCGPGCRASFESDPTRYLVAR